MPATAIAFGTRNAHKLAEAQREIGFPLRQYADGYDEVQADTLEEVVGKGMDQLDPLIEGRYFIDDSGIFIDSLGGFPGVYSAYVFKTLGNPGILRLMEGRPDRSATFACVIGYRDGNGRRHVVRGEAAGTLTNAPMGSDGFGYDPIFMPEGQSRTFAQMAGDEKNLWSHRGDAVRRLKAILAEEGVITLPADGSAEK